MTSPSDPAAGHAPLPPTPPARTTFDRWQKQHGAMAAALWLGLFLSPVPLHLALRNLSEARFNVLSSTIWLTCGYCYYGRQLALDAKLQTSDAHLVKVLNLKLQGDHPPWWRERLPTRGFAALPVWLVFAAWLLYTAYALVASIPLVASTPDPSVATTGWFGLYVLAIGTLSEARRRRREKFRQKQIHEPAGSIAKDYQALYAQKSRLENEIARLQQDLRVVNQELAAASPSVAVLHSLGSMRSEFRASQASIMSTIRERTGRRATAVGFGLGITGGIIANWLGRWIGVS